MKKLNKEQVLKQYGEYCIPYEVAKDMDEFKITWDTDLKEVRETINDFYNTGNDTKIWELDVICVIEFGSIDIELIFSGIEENKMDIGFFICRQNEYQVFENGYDNRQDDGWESYDYTDLEFDINMLDNKEKLEKDMYNSMMKTAKEEGLTWSKRNKIK